METDIAWFTVFLATSNGNLVFPPCGGSARGMQMPRGLQHVCV